MPHCPETLENISAPIIEGKSTNNIIQETQLRNEALRKNIDELQTQKLTEIDSVCRARSMSSLCFFLFMSNTLLLFLAGLEGRYGIYAHITCMVLCLFSAIYIVLGWCLGERQKPACLLNFMSLRHPIYGIVLMLILAFIAVVLTKKYIYSSFVQGAESSWWYYALLLFIALSYLNFVIFVGKIWHKARRFLNSINQLKITKKIECENAQVDIKDLLATCRLSDKLRSDDDTEEEDDDFPF